MSWSIEEARSLRSAGLSASQIGKRLGATRNAITGRLWRERRKELGLPITRGRSSSRAARSRAAPRPVAAGWDTSFGRAELWREWFGFKLIHGQVLEALRVAGLAGRGRESLRRRIGCQRLDTALLSISQALDPGGLEADADWVKLTPTGLAEVDSVLAQERSSNG